ncbi:MAG: FmdB family transcriptional regulator [Chloroflexi bacterium GWB2_49_20]|nr:MAG: FmdB family transcriptional regulator [Chloroflexi bacterium GWB2_49_20]OGN79543.1 MAG: FmdB family transcriptional regulator [Chloroflexi bacterium GWC2_49_37]OGN84534.1 MAG: FmdB family transcriptional regulator [Chloroflexi bacterium GWD2_49_16]HBG74042.1 FmdB family transcriptional regulator [Anaerolineae bacterium]HCC78844.1 FmdB family transcriptional regulator [Anaerolineae bacterium]
MPIYTYKCETCGIQFERQQSFSDQPLTRCPECNKKSLRKVYTPVGIVFKGSGFYATDHHSPSGQAPVSHSSEEKSEKKADESIKEPAKAEKTESTSDKTS